MESKFNVKKLVLWLIAIIVISFSISGVLFVSTGGILLSEHNAFHKTLDEEKIFAIDNIEEIHINVVSTDINFVPTHQENIKVHFHGDISGPTAYPSDIFSAEIIGDKLNINIKPKGVGIVRFNTALDLYVPKEFKNKISIQSVSSDTIVESLNIDSFDYKSVSGDLEMISLRTKKSKIKTTSGKIIGDDFAGDLAVESLSGDISIDYKEYNNDIEIETASGEVEIEFHNNPEFYLKIDTLSGDITNTIPITITGKVKKNYLEGSAGDSDNRILIKTISGDVELKK